MRIVVCVKQVPVDADLRLDEKRWTLVRQGVPSRINPHDLEALEVALSLRDQAGGEVLVFSMGPPQTEESLREALAMGADRAILLTDSAFGGADTLATSTVLAQAIRRLPSPADLILCGIRSADSDTAQVGPQVAEDLELPHVAYVTDIRVEEYALVVSRQVDRHSETIRVYLPALLTVLRASTSPRDIPFASIEDAFRSKEVQRWNMVDLGLEAHQVGFAGSATWVRRIREPEASHRANMVQGTPQEAVDAILRALRERYVIE
jgi:electron transfer flavoprotein beta subunit